MGLVAYTSSGMHGGDYHSIGIAKELSRSMALQCHAYKHEERILGGESIGYKRRCFSYNDDCSWSAMGDKEVSVGSVTPVEVGILHKITWV